jgi:hypothetical protein
VSGRRCRRRALAGALLSPGLCASIALALAGCGGGSRGAGSASLAEPTHVSTGSAVVSVLAASGDYHWTVPTAGPPPPIAAENRAPGTTAWRLPGSARLIGGAAHGPIAGYVAEQAISPGQTQRVFVTAPGARSVRVAVYRMGFYGGRGGRLVLESGKLPAITQPRCGHSFRTGLTECRWHTTLAFAIAQSLPSGVYLVKLSASTGAQSDCMFVLRSARPPALLVQIPTATYEAYNAWGGDSLYPGGTLPVAATHSTQGVEVSYDRPYESETGAGQFFVREVAIVRFLERYGYPVGYTTDASVDTDPGQLRRVRAVIDAGHSEYWSTRQEHAFARTRERGTSLLFLSSDTLAWRVRYVPAGSGSSEAGAPDHRVIAYKEFAGQDPDRVHPSGLFPGGGASLTGSAYDGCITPRVRFNGPGQPPPTYLYYPWQPSPALRPVWFFAGTGVTPSTRIPGISGYELDERAPTTPRGTRVLGRSVGVRCMGFDEPSPIRGSVAETTLYESPSGAVVFASGTLGWLYGLSPVPEASPDARLAPDGRVVAMTRNLLERVLAGGANG